MSSTDERRRKAQRAASMDPTDTLAVARAESEAAHAGGTDADWLRGLVGKWAFVEGARMNYRGHVKAIFVGATGAPTGILFGNARRVTHFTSAGGPQHEEPLGDWLLPYTYVHGICEQPKGWPTS